MGERFCVQASPTVELHPAPASHRAPVVLRPILLPRTPLSSTWQVGELRPSLAPASAITALVRSSLDDHRRGPSLPQPRRVVLVSVAMGELCPAPASRLGEHM